MMLLESVAYFCPNKRWGGNLAGILVAEALGVVVKMVSPRGMVARKSRDKAEAAARVLPHTGAGRDGSLFEDQRHSKRVMPTHPEFITPQASGGYDSEVVEEVAITAIAGDSCQFMVIDEVAASSSVLEADEELGTPNHYAAIVNVDGVRRPLPLFEVAPPLYSRDVSANRSPATPALPSAVTSA